MQCPNCEHLAVFVGVKGDWRLYVCENCGHEFDEFDGRIDLRVRELFRERFPAGSDGPDQGFELGKLYDQAIHDVIDQLRQEHENEIDRIRHKADPD